MNWCRDGLHRIQSTEIKFNTRGSIRIQNFCLLALFSSCLFFELRNTVPSWNLSLLSPGYLVVMAVWRTGFCFHFLLSLPLICSYLWGYLCVTGFPGLYLTHSMSSRGALTLFHPQGVDTKGQTGRTRHKPRLNAHFRAPSKLCSAKTFFPHIFTGQRTAPH